MKQKLTRRKVLSTIGLSGLGLVAAHAEETVTNFSPVKGGTASVLYVNTLLDLKIADDLRDGQVIQTTGYYRYGDGGHATYIIRKADTELQDDGGSILALRNGLAAELINISSVNYAIFGAVGDQQNDDGIQIKAAHAYANAKGLPVINLRGEYWFREANGIEIRTNTDWGGSIFHFDEKFNSREPRFKIMSDRPAMEVELTELEKASVISQLKPGVQVIPELTPYRNCFVIVSDSNDTIGLRMQARGVSKGWAREELFYVEEHGRIIGDIAWTFKDYTRMTAFPAGDSYLKVDGGTFYLSGNNEGPYFENGIRIQRSRTILSNQWAGLEHGIKDTAQMHRSGFYNLDSVYDVTLENIRLIPWEKDRPGETPVPEGTYGILGRRMMKTTFRNITAEGSPVHWGVFGTNLTKDFRIENCVLNRVDVHFHCWNLYIKDSKIGQRGLTLTGGGDLFIENTSVNNNTFVSFRADYGAKWDGDIRISKCRLIPRKNAGQAAVLQFTAADFDFKYPIGYGRTVKVEDMIIDFTGDPANKAVCWLMRTSEWRENAEKAALFFPDQLEFSNISVRGREQGVRLLKIFDCSKYYMPKSGLYDGVRLLSNSRIMFHNIELERMDISEAGDTERLHFYLNDTAETRPDALYPEISFSDCRNLEIYLGKGKGKIRLENCSLSGISKDEGTFKGKLSFSSCDFESLGHDEREVLFDMDAELGLSFSNCTVFMPKLNGTLAPNLLDRLGFMKINGAVRFNHLNTVLANDILTYLRTRGTKLSAGFIGMLRNHHELEP